MTPRKASAVPSRPLLRGMRGGTGEGRRVNQGLGFGLGLCSWLPATVPRRARVVQAAVVLWNLNPPLTVHE
jgi:hypothetical protein